MKGKNTSKPKHKIICTVINDLTTDQRMHRICSSLARAGHEVTLVGRELPNSLPLPSQPYHLKRIRCFWNKGFLFYLEYNIRLLFFLLKEPATVYNAVDLDTIMPAWLASRIRKRKVVYDAHEWFPYCPEIIVRPKIHWFWKKVESVFVPKMDEIYTVSQSIANEFTQLYGKPVQVVRNMPIVREFSPHPEEIYILYQGVLNMGRGLEELLDAMQDIDIFLYIAGAGDIENKLKQKVKQNRLQGKVVFLGNLSPEKLWEYTQNAYIGVNLLQNLGKNYYYSLANKYFDYVQAEVPQLTMDFPEYRKMNQQHEVALLIPDLEKDTIQEAILRLIHDYKLYAQLRAQCRRAKKKWNWKREEAHLISIYEKLPA